MILTGEQDLFSLLENQISIPDLTCNELDDYNSANMDPLSAVSNRNWQKRSRLGI